MFGAVIKNSSFIRTFIKTGTTILFKIPASIIFPAVSTLQRTTTIQHKNKIVSGKGEGGEGRGKGAS